MATMDGNGAAAAAVYFIELYGYVLQTGDLTEWNAMSFPQCQFCSSVHRSITSVYEAGGHIEGGSLSAEVIAVHELDGFIGGYPIDLRVTQQSSSAYSADGTVTEATAISTKSGRFYTVFVNGAWQIADVSGIEQSS